MVNKIDQRHNISLDLGFLMTHDFVIDRFKASRSLIYFDEDTSMLLSLLGSFYLCLSQDHKGIDFSIRSSPSPISPNMRALKGSFDKVFSEKESPITPSISEFPGR